MAIDITKGAITELLALKRRLLQHDTDIKRLWRRQQLSVRENANVIGGYEEEEESSE